MIYGITTGFGDLASVRISREDRAALQENLLRSHACGVGEPYPVDVMTHEADGAHRLIVDGARRARRDGVGPSAVDRKSVV